MTLAAERERERETEGERERGASLQAIAGRTKIFFGDLYILLMRMHALNVVRGSDAGPRRGGPVV